MVKSGTSKHPHIHFVGIGGIGISALARWFLAEKWLVTGCDLSSSEITRELAKEGVRVKIGQESGHINALTALVVHSQAILQDSPELVEARRLGIPTLSYPQAVGLISRRYETIAIAGAHGKSTTTAFLALVLIHAGYDPTVILGTKIGEFHNKNFRSGKSNYLVLEADEYGRAFLNYTPAITVVTNIDREHTDTYENIGETKATFLEFFRRTKEGGCLVLNRDNKILYSLKKKIEEISTQRELKLYWYSIQGAEAVKVKKVLRIPGMHNVQNAVSVYTVGVHLGIPKATILTALSKYEGSWRRLEFKGLLALSQNTFHVYDDYAHHPTEIRETLRAIRDKFPRSPIVCVFQPHQGKRLKALFAEFTNAFGFADITILVPMYKVPGREGVEDKKYNSEQLAAALTKKDTHRKTLYVPDLKNVRNAITSLFDRTSRLPHSPVIVMMGAGDIFRYTPLLLAASKRG